MKMKNRNSYEKTNTKLGRNCRFVNFFLSNRRNNNGTRRSYFCYSWSKLYILKNEIKNNNKE